MSRSPLRNRGVLHVEDIALGHRELGTKEHRRHGYAQQHGAHDAVDEQQRVVETRAVDVARLGPVLITDGLDNETEQDEHPQPIGTAETRTVEQRERGKEGAAKSHQRRVGQLPLAAHRVDEQRALVGLAVVDEHRLAALHHEQEHQQRAQHRHDEPPVIL